MKLYLSSYHIGNHPDCLKAMVGSNRKAAVITNAGDCWDTYRTRNLPKFIRDLADADIQAEELDLRNYFGQTENLKTALSQVGLIWVTGGNTFVLRRAMKESGLDTILPGLLRSGDIVYGGFSAGACVVSPSLKGIHLGDEPEVVPPGYPNTGVVWEGLGIIDFYIVPHFRSNHSESAIMENVISYYDEHKMPFYTLADGEALRVENGSIEKLS